MESPLALYRRYRPETFAEVIGQDHVTEPLRNALAGDRVNHAYLFSGPRGCGKTTSARILARALNCAQAPVADPCGECDSCRELARGGAGSIDVIEIDAASHGGVDDARDLREKAFFAPVRDRFKIYIIDEAHMVSSQGFNALLKLVEEPPPHLRFIFATTEPDKVLPTIRSRTHHYPFRLFPPKLVADYVAGLCEQEGIAVESAVLPLVARAGAGSMRDSLSVMDQLLGGAGPEGVTYKLAADLLGFTPETLLDEMIDAFAAEDGSSVFQVVDKVIETGRDPRRFTEDLLRRLRDLVIVAAVPDAPATGLLDIAQDAGERLVAQAARFGAADLSRAADVVAAGLTEMRGATAPRLLLELICARVLLPGADHDTEGVMARLDRIERRLDVSGTVSESGASRQRLGPTAGPAEATSAPGSDAAPPPPSEPAPVASPSTPAVSGDRPDSGERPAPPVAQPAPTHGEHEPMFPPPRFDDVPSPAREQDRGHAPQEEPKQSAQASEESASPTHHLSLVDVRRLWPDILERTKTHKRVAFMILSQNAQVVGVDDRTLTLGFNNAGARDSMFAGGYDEVLRQAAIDVVGAAWRIEGIVDPGAKPDPGRRTDHGADRGSDESAPSVQPHAEQPAARRSPTSEVPSSVAPDGPPDWAAPAPAAAPAASEGTQAAPAAAPASGPSSGSSAGPNAAREALARSGATPGAPAVDPAKLADEAVDPDDPAADTDGLDGTALLERELGARVVDEIKHT